MTVTPPNSALADSFAGTRQCSQPGARTSARPLSGLRSTRGPAAAVGGASNSPAARSANRMGHSLAGLFRAEADRHVGVAGKLDRRRRVGDQPVPTLLFERERARD